MKHKELRSFQNKSKNGTPGPSSYITPHDPSRTLNLN